MTSLAMISDAERGALARALASANRLRLATEPEAAPRGDAASLAKAARRDAAAAMAALGADLAESAVGAALEEARDLAELAALAAGATGALSSLAWARLGGLVEAAAARAWDAVSDEPAAPAAAA